MTDQLISFETAKLAKEKGFNIGTSSFWQVNEKTFGVRHETGCPRYYADGCDHYDEPTQSLLQKWLREIHKIDIVINVSSLTNEYWAFIPNFIRGDWKSHYFEIYEEALEIGLQKALNIINNDKTKD